MAKKAFGVLPFVLATLLLQSLSAAPRQSAARSKNSNAQNTLSSEFRSAEASRLTAATYKPFRTTPIQKGEFKVDLVVITFPDCEKPDPEDVRTSLNSLGGSFTIADYYKDYSQGITWPVLDVYPVVYEAPQPLGYYCRHDVRTNLIGYKGDGSERANKLRADALKYVASKGKLSRKGAYICYVYCKKLKNDRALLERILRPSYPPKPSQDELSNGAIDRLELYKPQVQWADPLWPNSIPQVDYPANGGTLVHEIGHLLGAPDFYHASEEHDGMPGTPSLPWSYGPTGMAYCRSIYNAFVPAAAYPKVTKEGDYTISPRSARFPMTNNEGIPPLGIFVPSSHPNYIFCIEYCKGEKPPVGSSSSSNEGLLIHVINVTMSSPMMGPPDLCYTYRSGDRDFKALNDGNAFLRPGDKFDANSDPAARLPNFLPAGIEITNIRFNEDSTCTFALSLPKVKVTSMKLKTSLLPCVEMIDIDAVMPTSFRAELNVRYRGEPLLTEYGFCYGTRKNPTVTTGAVFPLYHRDRYDARIIDLKPGTTYYVRSYAKSARGISYSENEKTITLPKLDACPTDVTLFSKSDGLINCWYYRRWYFGSDGSIQKTSDALLAFMALANYYRTLPGTSSVAKKPQPRAQQKSEGPFDMTRVHSSPSISRPKFRLAEVEKLRTYIEAKINEGGLKQPDFEISENYNAGGKSRKNVRPPVHPQRTSSARGKKGPSYGANAAWVAKCTAAFKIKDPENVFFSSKTEEEFAAYDKKIREWIAMSQPVLLIRQNKPMSDEISLRWPLDVVIIDGVGSNPGDYHVVYPNGCDRGVNSRKDGCMGARELLYRTTDAMLMFYRP